MNFLTTILAVILTACNILRYNLPYHLKDDISLFDILGLVALMIACIITLIPKKNVLTEGLIVYNILGCLDSLSDEIFFDPVLRTLSEWKSEVGIIIFCIGYMVYRVKVKGKSLL